MAGLLGVAGAMEQAGLIGWRLPLQRAAFISTPRVDIVALAR